MNTALKQAEKRPSRHPGMDCRDPEYKDVLIDITLYPIKLSIKISEWMHYECHPWQLDPGSPCRNDGSTTCVNITLSWIKLRFLILCNCVCHCKSHRTTFYSFRKSL